MILTIKKNMIIYVIRTHTFWFRRIPCKIPRKGYFFSIFISCLIFIPFNIKAAYVISSLDFTVSPTAGNYGRIGSEVKFQMMVLDKRRPTRL